MMRAVASTSAYVSDGSSTTRHPRRGTDAEATMCTRSSSRFALVVVVMLRDTSLL
jgi:hypothetical protein